MDRNEGVDMDCKNIKALDSNVQGDDGGRADGDNPKDRTGGKQTTWNQLESFSISSIGVTAFGVGLHRCESAEFSNCNEQFYC
jgi:hypothetical protein